MELSEGESRLFEASLMTRLLRFWMNGFFWGANPERGKREKTEKDCIDFYMPHLLWALSL